MIEKQSLLGEYSSSYRAAVSITSTHGVRANSFRTFPHTLDQTGCWFSNSWVDLREHHWFPVQDINQWRKVHLIPSPTLQKPSSTELVSLHYKSDRRCPKLCCKYPACYFALIESMHQKPRQREALSPCTHCPASTEIHRAGMFEGCTQRRRGMWSMREEAMHAKSPLYHLRQAIPQPVLTLHSAPSGSASRASYALGFSGDSPSGVHTYYGKGISLVCVTVPARKLVRAGVSTYKDTHATHTSTSSYDLFPQTQSAKVLSAAHYFSRRGKFF